MGKRLIVGALLACLLAATAMGFGKREGDGEDDRVTRPVDESIPVSAEGTVAVSSGMGSLSILGWDEDRLLVTGTIGEDVVSVEVTQVDEHTVEVKALFPDRDNLAGLDLESDLSVMVPKKSALVASTIEADLTVRGVYGAKECTTMMGNVEIVAVRGPVDVSTIGGAISVAGSVERVEFASAFGDVSISGVHGAISGRTTGGFIRVVDSTISDANISTDMGDIYMHCELLEDARLRATAVFGGAVELVLPPEVEGRFTLTGSPQTVDMDDFSPQHEIDWVFKEINGVGALRLEPIMGRVESLRSRTREGGTVTLMRSPGPAPGTRDQDGARAAIVDDRALRLGTALYAFTVGDGGAARVFLESQFAGPRRGEDESEDENGSGARVVLRTD